jgi:hypothetical protein
MSENEERENLPAIADDFLIQVADQAERRVDAVMKIKRVSLKVTNARDWTDQNGNPYLQVSGSEKIANLFNISWRIDEPLYNEEPDGHFTWTYKGYFTLGGRSIEAIGTRSSKDAFFNKYSYGDADEEGKKKKTLLPPSAIDKGDVKKAAMTNLFGNGITRILGIRNLTWDDLKEFAGITKDQVSAIQYRKGGEKPSIQEPQKKNGDTKTDNLTASITIKSVEIQTKDKSGKDLKSHRYHILSDEGKRYVTFDKKFYDLSLPLAKTTQILKVEYKETQFGNDIVNLSIVEPEEPPEPGSEG